MGIKSFNIEEGYKKEKKKPKKPEKNKKWIQPIKIKMEKKGTVGKFSREAKREGESTLEHAKEIKGSPNASTKEKREAQFAINMSKIRHKKKK